ncbi:MAG: M48 family metallopeptidase [Dehalococcoidaceae bacterium]|nr:M48 family metallopeptidase [Dehalococcoidaceae bacterium]
MNILFYIILSAILLEYILGVVANLLNMKALRSNPPAVLEDIYREEEYKKAQEYTRTRIQGELAAGSFTLAVLLVFWFAGGFNLLDQAVRQWAFGPVVNGLIYIGILAAAYSLLTLPFGVYSTFVVEERFGFNRTTPKIFISDMVKSLALAVLLGGPLLAGVLAIFEYGGAYAWLYCWVGVTVITLFLQYLSPTWIMPLFNKFTRLEEGELRDAIFAYARLVDFPLQNVFVMDGSRRSTKSNAFFTGFGRNKRIALFDTLIAKHTTQELVAVLAHEIGHHKKKHILQGAVISILHTGALLFLLSVFITSPGLHEAFFMEDSSVYTGILFFGLLYTPIELALSIILQVLSRRNEYEADRFAAETTGGPQQLVSALKKLAAGNLSNLTPHPFYVFLYYSHPPLKQRIEAISQPEPSSL